MDINLPVTLSISSIYVALLGLLFVPITMRIGLYRSKNKIDIGDAGDKKLLRMVRSHANFTETVPLALILLVILELTGGSQTLLHAMGVTLVVSRVLHYIGLSRIGPFIARPIGMLGTMTVYVVCSVALLYALI